jgi:adenine-specific DNA-methyltransferase
MPELQFKGKEFVYNHHLTVPYRPLEMDASKSIGKPSLNGNLIIHGDNLHALKALLPMYAGKVDCIFIDPPYNTGNEGWNYNDNVNSPMMKEWLSSNPVNAEDMLRHDKWCAMMYPRLKLLTELMSKTAVIFICIDDNELCHLRIILDEILGDSNWVGTIVWKNVTDNNPTRVSIEHEYIVCFSQSKDDTPREWGTGLSEVKAKLVEIGEQLVTQHKNAGVLQAAYSKWLKENKPYLWPLDRYKYIDKGGVYTGSQSVHNPGREGYRYDVRHPKTGKPCKEPLMGYRFPQETMEELLKAGKILFGEDENKIIELKVYAREFEDKLPSVIELDGRIAAYELRELFPDRKKPFDNAKPSQLVEQVLSFVASPGSIVLDSFAGSGTTAQAVLALNQRDNGDRRFILVEGEEYADELTAERVRRVIRGGSQSQAPLLKKGLRAEFTYCTLGDPLELDKILTGKKLPDYEAIGAWLYHTATGEALATSKVRKSEWYLGESTAYHVWLVYKPELEFLKSSQAALTLELAEKIAKDPERSKSGKRHLVFAPAKYVPNKTLLPMGVEYAPLPFALYRVEKD